MRNVYLAVNHSQRRLKATDLSCYCLSPRDFLLVSFRESHHSQSAFGPKVLLSFLRSLKEDDFGHVIHFLLALMLFTLKFYKTGQQHVYLPCNVL